MTIRMLTAGESHGPALTVILDGLPAGLPLTHAMIDRELRRRQTGKGSGARMKIEHDTVRILAGVMNGMTTGAPISLMVVNADHKSWQGKQVAPLTIPRPGHADLTAAVKYGYSDLRLSFERASARETATRVAAGAVCKQFLLQFGIQVEGYVVSLGQVNADLESIPLQDRFSLAEADPVRCPDPLAARAMQAAIQRVMQDGDTLGGVIEVLVRGLPPGLGSFAQWDRRLDARLGAALLSIPAIKGVEIGPAFSNARLTGTQVQDSIQVDGDRLVRSTNRSGGLEGGVSTGQPLVLRAAFKPIASTLTPQPSVDLATSLPAETHYERSDFCPVPRAVPILEAMAALVLADVLIEKLGGDSLAEMLPRFLSLRQAILPDLKVDRESQVYWPADQLED